MKRKFDDKNEPNTVTKKKYKEFDPAHREIIDIICKGVEALVNMAYPGEYNFYSLIIYTNGLVFAFYDPTKNGEDQPPALVIHIDDWPNCIDIDTGAIKLTHLDHYRRRLTNECNNKK